ncbi:MAG: GyrI-like domain-containing protein [Ignavibacteria bacterium]|jgi:hypothetical protein|nr:GyrI-like domain-containing protein [Ignavibacteria bacterium]
MNTIKDYKKEEKNLYLPKTTPTLIDVPEMNFVSVIGKGNPNEEDGEYQKALNIIYSISYTIKMSKNGNETPEGYFDYVVPPLEGLWWLDGDKEWTAKSDFNWSSLIRLPEFVNENVFEWACNKVRAKKGISTDKAKFIKFKEGMCVQCMHLGSYDDEPRTLKLLDDFIAENDLLNDINEERRHHEIYLSALTKPADSTKMKTVLRIPVKKKT